MSRRCPECGGLLGAGDAACRSCGHVVAPAGDRTAKPSRGHLEPRSAAPVPQTIEFGDPNPAPAGARGPISSLGDIPAATDADAFDLSAILDAGPVPSAPPAPVPPPGRGGFVPSFTFPGTEGAPVDPEDLGGSEGETLPDPAVAASTPGRPARGPDGRSASAAASDGWRVRNAAGTTYDMVSVESVVQWLQSKEDLDGIRIARGSGGFKTVEEFPEIMARLGLKPSSGAGFGGSEAAVRLDLDMPGRRPGQTRAPQGQRAEARSAPPRGAPGVGAQPGQRPAPAKAAPVGRTFGMGLTLLLAGATVVAMLALGPVLEEDAPPASVAPPNPAELAPEPPPGPALQAALHAFEAQRYTAAEQLLMQAARTEKDDPRVFRYLALTLSKLGGRDREARAALAEYRRTRARSGGE